MTCKDCLSDFSCSSTLQKMKKGKAEQCPYFKNKADYVEVVKCKDCIHYYSYDDFDRSTSTIYKSYDCKMLHRNFGKEGYCYLGVRRDT